MRRSSRTLGLFSRPCPPREREVLSSVAAGLMNKQIAAEIGIAEITVKIHRGHIMKKMGTRSLADLVRITEMLGISRAKS
jgi:FixJ family two-component response regulator